MAVIKITFYIFKYFDSENLISLLNFKAELEKNVPVGSTFQESFDKACASIKDDRAKVNKAKKKTKKKALKTRFFVKFKKKNIFFLPNFTIFTKFYHFLPKSTFFLPNFTVFYKLKKKI